VSDQISHREIDRIVSELYRDLDLGTAGDLETSIDLEGVLGAVLDLPEQKFLRVAFDLSCLIGVSGDWQLAHDIYSKLEGVKEFTATQQTKLWHTRCLIELERYSEALAIVRAVRWSDSQQIHVNYLSGLAFESLNMNDDAQVRFAAVHRKNPNYQDVAQRLRTV